MSAVLIGARRPDVWDLGFCASWFETVVVSSSKAPARERAAPFSPPVERFAGRFAVVRLTDLSRRGSGATLKAFQFPLSHMDSEDGDVGAIRSLAVTTDDVVAAYEARQRSSRRAVLRVNPPFSGRMRARLHVAEGEDRTEGDDGDADVEGRESEAETAALHLDPARLVAEDDLPAYPSPDDTEDELRADPDAEFSVERHRERHVQAVEAWRDAVADAVVEAVELRTPEGPHRVEVKALG